MLGLSGVGPQYTPRMRWEEWRQRRADTFWAMHEAKEREWMLREDPMLKHEARHPLTRGHQTASHDPYYCMCHDSGMELRLSCKKFS